MTTEQAETPAMSEDWILSGHELWKFQTADGYLGEASWRPAGAAMTVTRPDGTDLLRKKWSSRQIFPASWPAMFNWLKGQVVEQIAADRAKRDAPPEVAAAPPADPEPSA